MAAPEEMSREELIALVRRQDAQIATPTEANEQLPARLEHLHAQLREFVAAAVAGR